MAQRKLSAEKRAWWKLRRSGWLVVAILVLGVIPMAIREYQRAATFWLAAFFLILFLGFYVVPVAVSSVRTRRYVWQEVFEEEGCWLFLREGERLEVKPGEVQEIYHHGYLKLLVLRSREQPLRDELVMFCPSTDFAKAEGISVLEEMRRRVRLR